MPRTFAGSSKATTITLALLWAVACGHAPAADAPDADHVRIAEVDVAVSPVGPVVLLKAGGRAIPVFVDQTVAESIHAAKTRQPPPRPLTHDLMRKILESYEGRVTRVVVRLVGQTFHGALTIEMAGETKVFDSRSSDAIALAIHFSAPIWVSRELLDAAGKPIEVPGGRKL